MVLIAALKSEASISFRVTLLTGKSSKLACFCQYVLPCKINPREFTSVSEIREPPRNRGRPREFARAANSQHQLRIRGGTRNRAIRCDIAMAGYCSGSANSQRPRIRSGSANSHKTRFTNVFESLLSLLSLCFAPVGSLQALAIFDTRGSVETGGCELR